MITKVNNTVLDLENPSIQGLDMGGNVITNHGSPVSATDVATKTYVDGLVGGSVFLPLVGGTMAGLIDMNGFAINDLPAPVFSSDPATKGYVDARGKVIQGVRTAVSSAIVSGANPTYPLDDTIPQQTLDSGFLLTALNTTITPTNAANTLKIEVTLMWTQTGTNTQTIFALFRDSAEDAIAATGDNNHPLANLQNTTHFSTFVVAGSTSPTTFKIGVGDAGSAGIYTFNGVTGARLFGGVALSQMAVSEIAA
jgi:hypothetical protein